MMSDRNDRKAVMYIRCASQNKSEQIRAIISQKQAIRQYASKHRYDIVGEYIDSGRSGITLERPALDQLRKDVKNRQFDCVITYDTVRIARRYELQILVEEELEAVKVQLVYINPPSNVRRLIASVAKEYTQKNT